MTELVVKRKGVGGQLLQRFMHICSGCFKQMKCSQNISSSVKWELHVVRVRECACEEGELVLQCDTYTWRLVLGEHAPCVIVQVVFEGGVLRLTKAIDKI